jgi:hypothetical protein
MLVKVIKPFRFSPDGINSRLVAAGEEVEVGIDHAPGLSAEGFIDGEPHGLPLLSQARKDAIIERVVAMGRIEMAKYPDERLLHMAAEMDLAEAHQAAIDEEDEIEQQDDTLLGSSLLPALVDIGGVQVQLGGLVVAAQVASGLTVNAWNDLPEADREERLSAAVARLAANADALKAEIDPNGIAAPVEPPEKVADVETKPDAEGAADPAALAQGAAPEAVAVQGEQAVPAAPAAAVARRARKSGAKKAAQA